jgi:hypothetical protein
MNEAELWFMWYDDLSAREGVAGLTSSADNGENVDRERFSPLPAQGAKLSGLDINLPGVMTRSATGLAKSRPQVPIIFPHWPWRHQ